ncbi:MAG: ABC transporter permease [Vicinamibacterales bacterium]
MTETRAWPPLVELTRVRIVEFIREPEAIFWAFVFPILMTVTLGIAFPSSGNDPILVGLPRGDGGAARTMLDRAGGFELRELAPDAILPALRDGDVHIVVVPGDPPTYQFDPTRAESRLARLAVDDALKRHAGRQDPWHAREERVTIPGSRYVDWLLPGLLGVNIMTTGVWGIGFSIVQARSRKLLKRLVASPMRKSDYLLAQVLARLVLLVGEVGALVAFGLLVLGTPIRGSWATIAAIALIGALAFGGFGLLVASRARTFEAISGLVNVAVLPMWIVSGVFFSSANFPDAVQPVIQALPLTALNDGLRATMLEGASLAQVTPDLLVLAAWGILPFAVALRIFRWT